MQVSFIHCADLHLDSPMIGLRNLPKPIQTKLQESTFLAFKKIVDTAINKQVDFMIIAGDIYEVEDRSIRAQIRFREEMLRLKESNIQVYLIHGNHDHLNGNWVHIKLPENVHIFPTVVSIMKYTKENAAVNLYGFSYETRHISDRRIDQYIKEENANFHIGILHGSLEGNVEHSVYAPFKVQDLLSKNMDYWALGHIHKRMILKEDPPIIYPGNLQGRHKKETEIKGCYYVELKENQSQIEFIPSSQIIWNAHSIDAKHISSFDELYTLCQKEITQIKDDSYSYILSLEIENLTLEDSFSVSELLEILQQDEGEVDNFIWVREVKIHENVQWIKQNLKKESAFYDELFAITKDTTQVEKAITPLYHHSKAHRFLQDLSDEEKMEWMKEAEELLIKMLISK